MHICVQDRVETIDVRLKKTGGKGLGLTIAASVGSDASKFVKF